MSKALKLSKKYKQNDLFNATALPVDCNSEAEIEARKYGDPELIGAMAYLREHKEYGELIHRDIQGNIDIVFAFTCGVCRHWTPILNINKRNTFKRSIINEKIEK